MTIIFIRHHENAVEMIQPINDSISINELGKKEKLLKCQKHFSVAAMFLDLSEHVIEVSLRKYINKLLLQANMAELKMTAAIIKVNLDKESDLQLRQLLRILQHMWTR